MLSDRRTTANVCRNAMSEVDEITEGVAAVTVAATKRGKPCKRCLKKGEACFQHTPKPDEGTTAATPGSAFAGAATATAEAAEDSHEDVRQYLTELDKKLEERELHHFWVMSSNKTSFKLIKNVRVRDIKAMLADRVEHYKNKRIAEVDVWMNPNKIDTGGFVMSIKVVVCQISEEAEIERRAYDTWGVCINFYPEELRKTRFSLKMVEALMRLAHNKTLVTDTLNGMRYTNLLQKLKKMKIPWEFNVGIAPATEGSALAGSGDEVTTVAGSDLASSDLAGSEDVGSELAGSELASSASDVSEAP